MEEHVLLGRGRDVLRVGARAWRRALEEATRTPSPRLGFMTAAHHRVRDAAVREISRRGQPLSRPDLSAATGLDDQSVARLLDDLEARLFFLVRNDAAEVSWAFPVTSEPTPHRVRFSTGEETYAA